MIFLSVYELSAISVNERVIEETLNNQLDAILFSVNQYTEDVVNDWAARISLSAAEENSGERGTGINKLLSENPISMVFLADDIGLNNFTLFNSGQNIQSGHDSAAVKNELKEIFRTNEARIRRLYTYSRGGYRKIETLTSPGQAFSGLMVFLPNDGSSRICGISINAERFIYSKMAPKLQEVSRGKFIITVLGQNNNAVYSTEGGTKNEVAQMRPLWLLPSFNLGITLKGATIGDLIKSRYRMSLILVACVNILLIAGIWLVFRNIKKEMRLAQIKSDFVSNVSHELRTPLALISMFAETLEMDRVRTEEKKKEYYGIISQEAGRLSRIVNKILSFSQIEAGKKKYNLRDADLNVPVEEIFNTYKFHMQNNGFHFGFEPAMELPVIKADCEAVSQAVINLIDNAAKYSREKKEVTILTGVEDEYVFIEVMDKGIGIPAEDHQRIFEKFFRVSTGDVHNVKGTGLGLALVKHVMDAHGGKIEVTSTIGQGSSFRLLFPKDKNSHTK